MLSEPERKILSQMIEEARTEYQFTDKSPKFARLRSDRHDKYKLLVKLMEMAQEDSH